MKCKECPNCGTELLQNQLVPTLYMCKKCYESDDYKLPFFDEKQLRKNDKKNEDI